MSLLLRLLVVPALLAPQLLLAEAVAVLRVGDAINMRVTGVPAEFAQDFTLLYTIGQKGTVNVPLLGEVKAVGLTANQLERVLQDQLVAKKIFTQPTVIINPTPDVRTVSVNGGVRAPGPMTWSEDLTLRSAIGGRGGLSDFSDKKGIQIIREGKVAGRYNWSELEKDPAKDPKLLPGDQIWVRGD